MSTPGATGRVVAVDPLVNTALARGSQHAVALVIDAVCILGTAGASAVAFVFDVAWLGWILVALAVVAVIASVAALALTGRTLGHAAADTRTVSVRSGAPSGIRLLGDLVRGRLRTFDIRSGRDPIAPALAPFTFPESSPLDAALAAAASGRSFRRPALVGLDSGERIVLESTLVLGRSPAATPELPGTVYQWSDLSRTLSKSHARLEWDGQIVWITDLGSTNGTAIATDDGDQPLLPLQRTPLATSATLRLGDRTLTVAVPA